MSLKIFSMVAVLAVATTACAHVAPNDRGLLAHPTMTTDIATAAEGHVHAVHEGAAGGGGLAESGCGCN